MNNCFVDTTAFYAILDADDQDHRQARKVWQQLLREDSLLATTSYILVESCALLQHRLGLAAVRTFRDDIYPLLHIEWLDCELHEAGIDAVLTAQRRKLSLVDCVSFNVMRRRGLHQVFAFDRHFAEQGFTCLPK